jgi:transposase
VPIHDRLGDGNTTDDRTPIETWEALRQLCNRADFLYIADCKLCTREQRGHIARPGGLFITVLPRTRKEDAWFRRHIQDHDITWREVLHEPNRRCVNAALNIGSVNELALCSAEGYRRVGVFSSLKAENDPNARLKALEKTYASIEALNEKLKGKRTRPKERGRVFEAAQTILEQSGAQRWVDVDIVEHDDVLYRQKGAGRPGPNTGYEKQIRTRFEVLYQPNAEAIAYEAKSDGMFPLQSRSTVAQGGFEKVPLPAQAREAP